MLKALPLREFPGMLTRPGVVLEVAREHLGHQVRSEGFHSDHWLGGPRSHAMIFLIDGSIELTGGERVQPNDMLVVGPSFSQGITFSEGSSYLELWFRFHIKSNSMVMQEEFLLDRKREDLTGAMEQTCHCLALGESGQESVRRFQLALLLERVLHPPGELASEKGLDPSRRAQLLRYIQTHLHKNPEPGELAKVLGLSQDYFSRVFRETFGTSPRNWIHNQRLNRAAKMLVERKDSVSEIAHQGGWNSVPLFSRQFKREFGKTPSQYRLEAIPLPFAPEDRGLHHRLGVTDPRLMDLSVSQRD
jgi:AraC-like DNA-binding protein